MMTSISFYLCNRRMVFVHPGWANWKAGWAN